MYLYWKKNCSTCIERKIEQCQLSLEILEHHLSKCKSVVRRLSFFFFFPASSKTSAKPAFSSKQTVFLVFIKTITQFCRKGSSSFLKRVKSGSFRWRRSSITLMYKAAISTDRTNKGKSYIEEPSICNNHHNGARFLIKSDFNLCAHMISREIFERLFFLINSWNSKCILYTVSL